MSDYFLLQSQIKYLSSELQTAQNDLKQLRQKAEDTQQYKMAETKAKAFVESLLLDLEQNKQSQQKEITRMYEEGEITL